MTTLIGRVLGAAMLTTMLHGGAAMAQESSNRVAVTSDWNVFAEESPKECWGVTVPKETVNTRDGQPVSVRRGDILLFVTFRPGTTGEISFTGGYPFANGSTVTVEVDGQSYDLFTDGEWAWPATPACWSSRASRLARRSSSRYVTLPSRAWRAMASGVRRTCASIS